LKLKQKNQQFQIIQGNYWENVKIYSSFNFSGFGLVLIGKSAQNVAK